MCGTRGRDWGRMLINLGPSLLNCSASGAAIKSQSEKQVRLQLTEGTQNSSKDGLKGQVENGLINEKLTFTARDKGGLQALSPAGLARWHWS